MVWLLFQGRARGVGTRVLVLVPHDDPGVSIRLSEDDVSIRGTDVFVREGATALSIQVPSDARARVTPIQGLRGRCPGRRSRCLGGVEYCCDATAVGQCDGRWDDC
jgi:hypothetical protein